MTGDGDGDDDDDDDDDDGSLPILAHQTCIIYMVT